MDLAFTWPRRAGIYTRIVDSLSLPAGADRPARMSAVVDALWAHLGKPVRGPISWVGFYTPAPDGQSLLLGPRRDKPACSPIGLHGACGRCFTSRRALVVIDVANLGAGYIACDPNDQSEVVVPAFEFGASDSPPCWGVLDIDSHETSAFISDDAASLMRILEKAGLSPVPARVLTDAEVV
ncbi:MAG: hypothetical protein H7Y88_01835 [Phycisphaerales bacterium]|nr:hypothetical protein [Phycisphaerales bacterium]